MSSYTSSSKAGDAPVRSVSRLFVLTALMLVALATALETGARWAAAPVSGASPDVAALMLSLPAMPLSGRDLDNRMLVHNVALFSRYPTPESVTTAYVGTSRSKVLQPDRFGVANAVVGAGNTYNEVTYGLLLQAEILRLRFPAIKRVFVESSFLLRRPGRLLIEDDHRKYLPLLRSLAPLCAKKPDPSNCKPVFDALGAGNALQPTVNAWRSEAVAQRGKARFSALLAPPETAGTTAFDVPFMATLAANGERRDAWGALRDRKDQLPTIANDNIKVQRMRDIASNKPWDGLFDLVALWGREHDIEVIFFQPPVRSDLYSAQLENGLVDHVLDLRRVATEYGLVFIDLDRPELGYLQDWALFSDEDHLETCVGSGLFVLALESGYQSVRRHGPDSPLLTRTQMQGASAAALGVCR